MKNNHYFLFSVILIVILFLLPRNLNAFEIPEIGEGVCVFNCPTETTTGPATPKPTPTPTPTTSDLCPNDCSENGVCINGVCDCFQGWQGSDCSIPTSSITSPPSPPPPPPAITIELDTTVEVDEEVLESLKEGDFETADSKIKSIIESLTKAKSDLFTDPELEKLREDLQKLAKAERLLGSSIKNHQKASSNINRLLFEHTGGRTKQRLLQDSEKRIKRGLILTKTAGSVITRGVLGR